jgi:hypothetical protein
VLKNFLVFLIGLGLDICTEVSAGQVLGLGLGLGLVLV